MEEHFVWMTARQIQPGTLADFERAWRPGTHPEGMLRAYAWWSEDEREIVGISLWVSRASCEAWRASEAEARRREARRPTSWGSRKRSTGAASWSCRPASGHSRLAAAGSPVIRSWLGSRQVYMRGERIILA